MMLQFIVYFIVCGFLLFIMKGFDRVLLTYAVFSKDILPGVELKIEASDNISGDEEQRALEEAHQRHHLIARTSMVGRRSFTVAWVTASGALVLSIMASLIFSSEILLKTILACGFGTVVLSMAIMLFTYRKISRLISLITQDSPHKG
jgi:hypothetical protein